MVFFFFHVIHFLIRYYPLPYPTFFLLSNLLFFPLMLFAQEDYTAKELGKCDYLFDFVDCISDVFPSFQSLLEIWS